MTAYLIMTTIVLLNFIIAILADIYSQLQSNSKNLYYNQLIKIKQYSGEDKHYSSLVAAVVPFNIVILPFVPFLIYKKSERLNSILMYYCYIPVIFVTIANFLIVSLLWLPVTYIAIIKEQVKCIFKRSSNRLKTVVVETSYLAIFILFGVFLVLIIIIKDLCVFCITLFNKNTKVLHFYNRIEQKS